MQASTTQLAYFLLLTLHNTAFVQPSGLVQDIVFVL